MDSPATSPRSDTSARSRTRSATTVVSVSVGEVEESPTLLPPGSPELVWERALVPYSDGISSPLDLEDAGRREQRAIVLDMCYAHLVRRGFGVLELASPSPPSAILGYCSTYLSSSRNPFKIFGVV